jgi:hypothetical protein
MYIKNDECRERKKESKKRSTEKNLMERQFIKCKYSENKRKTYTYNQPYLQTNMISKRRERDPTY